MITVGIEVPDAATLKANFDAQKAQQAQQAQEAAQKAQAGGATDKLAHPEKPSGKDDPGYDRSNLRNLPDLRAGGNGADRNDKSDQAAPGTSDATEQALQNVRALQAKDALRRDAVDRRSAEPSDYSNPAQAKQPADGSKLDGSPQDAGRDHGAIVDRNIASGIDHRPSQTETTHAESQAEGASRQEKSSGSRDASGESKTGYDATILPTDGKGEADAAHRPGPADETYYDRANLRELPQLRLGDQHRSVAEVNWSDRLSRLESGVRRDNLPETTQSPEANQQRERGTVARTEARAAGGSDARAAGEPAATDSPDNLAQANRDAQGETRGDPETANSQERAGGSSGKDTDASQTNREENFRREMAKIKQQAAPGEAGIQAAGKSGADTSETASSQQRAGGSSGKDTDASQTNREENFRREMAKIKQQAAPGEAGIQAAGKSGADTSETASSQQRAGGSSGKDTDASQTNREENFRREMAKIKQQAAPGEAGMQAGGKAGAGTPGEVLTRPPADSAEGAPPPRMSPREVRQAVRDFEATGIHVDVEVHEHRVAPAVRAEKGVSGADVQSGHLGPTSALRDTAGYVRGEALTTLLSKDTHQAFDNHWKAAFNSLAASGRTEMTVQELYSHVAEAIRSLPDETQKKLKPVITAREKGTLEFLLHHELYSEPQAGQAGGLSVGGLGLKPDDKVRMPYAKEPMGSGPADKHAVQPNPGPRIEPTGPTLNERGEVVGSKADGATAKMEAREAARSTAETGQPETMELRSEPSRPPVAEPRDVQAPPVPEYPPAPVAADSPTAVPHGVPDRLAGAVGLASRVLSGLGAAAELVGNFFDAAQMYVEAREIVVRERPDLLPEGKRVPLTMLKGPLTPMFEVPSGYSVEKTDGRVIYRDEKGHEVPRDEAIKNSEGNREDRDRMHTA